MENENINDISARSNDPPGMMSEEYIRIKIPKRKIKAFFRRVLPILFLISLAMNIFLLHSMGRMRYRTLSMSYTMPAIPEMTAMPEMPERIEPFRDRGRFDVNCDRWRRFKFYNNDDVKVFEFNNEDDIMSDKCMNP